MLTVAIQPITISGFNYIMTSLYGLSEPCRNHLYCSSLMICFRNPMEKIPIISACQMLHTWVEFRAGTSVGSGALFQDDITLKDCGSTSTNETLANLTQLQCILRIYLSLKVSGDLRQITNSSPSPSIQLLHPKP
jgi:hypothetical protein